MPAKKDLTNIRFGKLLILREEVNNRINNQPTWKCQCDCGQICYKTTRQLKTLKNPSCGCVTGHTKDITGNKYGKLTAISPTAQRSHGSTVWKCQCECGNIVYARLEGLRVGDNTSCGCYNKAKELFAKRYKVDLVGKKYGKLTVLEATNERTPKGNQIWKCLCDCGNVTYVSTNHLQTGNTKSCGCLQGHSAGELLIAELLKENNIKYKQEYVFKDLPGRRYDFAIFDDNNKLLYLIEFDGEQHYIEAPHFKLSLGEQQIIDKIKTKFAKKNNIPLIRVPYWKRNNLTINDLLL